MSKSSVSVGTQGWADRINTAWRKAATAYIDIGNLLIECKKTVAHGDWTEMVGGKLDFDERTAQRLMKIARDTRLSNPAHAPLLPQHWTTLYEMTKLSDEEIEVAFRARAITKNTQRSDVRRLRTPHVTDAEYQEVQKSPPGDAVSAPDDSEQSPLAAPAGPPLDEREGGESVVIIQQPELPMVESAPPVAAPTSTDQANEAFVTLRIKRHAMDRLVNGALLMMGAAMELSPEDAVRWWPEDVPLWSDDFDRFGEWLSDCVPMWRERWGNGNDAALEQHKAAE